MLEELTTLDKLHDEVDTVGFLEDVVHANYKRMVDLIKDEFLDLERFDGLMLDDDILPDALHGVMPVVLFVVDEVDLAKCSPSNDAD